MSNTLNLGTDGNWATKKEAVLAYNSENNNFKPLPFSFDRGSIATVVNKDGLIETVGVDEPRIDFTDNTKGHLLLEPSRRNDIPYSEDFSQWTNSNSSDLSNQIISPDGSQNADKLITNDGSINGQVTKSISKSATATTYTYSVFAKVGEWDSCNLYVTDTSSFNNRVQFFVDLTNGQVLQTNTFGTFSNSSGTSEYYGNGWYRFSVTFTSGTETSITARIYSFDSNETNGDGTSGIYIWGAMLEAGSYATSYIPTSGSAVTRSAESCSQTPPDGVIGQTEGTVFLDSKMALQSINNYQLFSINNDGTSDRIRILTATGNRLRFIYQLNGGTTYYSFYNPTDFGNLTDLKIAFTYKSGDIKVYINGVLADSSTNTFTIAEKLIDIDIATSAGGYNQMSFKDIKLYNTALTDQELIALTQV